MAGAWSLLADRPAPGVIDVGMDPTSDPPTRLPVVEGPGGPAPTKPAIGVRSGRLEDLEAPPPPPARVEIPEVGIDAPVVPVGVDEAAAVAVPDDVRVAGWYRFGPAPGRPGSAVITAHVDGARQGAGVFFELRRVTPGALVTVTDSAGERQEFEVVALRSHPKATLPVQDLFARSGPPVLSLVTCGGSFDPVTRTYDENVVVYAVPT